MRRSRLIDSSARRGVRLRFTGIVLLGLATLAGAPQGLAAADPAACRAVRFSDVGWTDIAATTALASRILEGLGYEPTTQILSIPVTYAAMKNRQIDVYLGDWQPSMELDRRPFLADASIEVVRPNLEGAKYTLAVPAYVARAGVRSFADLEARAGQFGRRIYGIESGNNGNRFIAEMIAKDRFSLGGWTLVESSEQGMLSEVERAVRKGEWIVFLAWSPHPMNIRYSIEYLSGGDDTFGANYGGATIYTDVRAGYLGECPNVATLLRQLEFTPAMESALMALILDGHREGRAAATQFIRDNPAAVRAWLAGVTTLDGRPGWQAVDRSVRAAALPPIRDWLGSANEWIVGHKLPVGTWWGAGVQLAMAHAQRAFDVVAAVLGALISGITVLLVRIPVLVLVALSGAVAYAAQRSTGLVLFVVAALLLVDNLGYWEASVETLSLVLCATAICIAVGVPLGIAAAHRPWLFGALRPVLDLMQTIPTFVYLIPTLVLFGLGPVPGLISTIIFALPAPIRLTHLGITSVPFQLVEVGTAFGATRRQLLFKVELPHALPTIMEGVTQCIMLSLSMVVIAALVGANGLGKPVVRALNSVNIAMGFEAGLAIVILAIILDRVFRRHQRRR